MHNPWTRISSWTKRGQRTQNSGHKTSETIDFTWLEEQQFPHALFVDTFKFYNIYYHLSTPTILDI